MKEADINTYYQASPYLKEYFDSNDKPFPPPKKEKQISLPRIPVF